MTRILLFAAAMLLVSAHAFAADLTATTARCAFCHGDKGVSGNPIWPSLAGLDAGYLEKRMNSYRAGDNTSANALQMRYIFNGFSAQDISQIAQFYAAMPSPEPQGPSNAEGASLYHSGFGDTVAPCSSCHGAGGEGNVDLSAPRLAGQSAHYMAKQLAAYAEDKRPDQDSGMADTAKALTPGQRQAVSVYLQSMMPSVEEAPNATP